MLWNINYDKSKSNLRLARFTTAVNKSQQQLIKLKMQATTMLASASEEIGFLLDAYLAMLTNSHLTRGVEERIRTHYQNAEAAVNAEIALISQSFICSHDHSNDDYLTARKDDIRELGMRLLRNLMNCDYHTFSSLPVGTILVTEEMSLADVALIDPHRIAGVATVLGGSEGHAAIMIRSLGIPAVLGLTGLLKNIKSGQVIIIDGGAGHVIIDPIDSMIEQYRSIQKDYIHKQNKLRANNNIPAVTLDGIRIELQANVEFQRDLPDTIDFGASGIGLLRTEFMFMNRHSLPDEEEQYQILRDIVNHMAGRPITMRTLDVGGEKKLPTILSSIVPSGNPALGLRGVRLGLHEPDLLRTQLAAMLRASAHGVVRILLPLICTANEVIQVREMIRSVARQLLRRHVTFADPLPPLGIMIEVPGAALAADSLAQVSDFFAIGTNDLTQYTLAIDRSDEQVSSLYEPLHPAVLRLIQFAIEAGVRREISVSVCGEMAGDPRYTALLLGLGVQELSMIPRNIPAVKHRIRSMSLNAAKEQARTIMHHGDANQIGLLLDDFNATLESNEELIDYKSTQIER